MSVINQMLKDLDARKAQVLRENDPLMEGVYVGVGSAESNARWFGYVSSVILAAVLFGIVFFLLKKSFLLEPIKVDLPASGSIGSLYIMGKQENKVLEKKSVKEHGGQAAKTGVSLNTESGPLELMGSDLPGLRGHSSAGETLLGGITDVRWYVHNNRERMVIEFTRKVDFKERTMDGVLHLTIYQVEMSKGYRITIPSNAKYVQGVNINIQEESKVELSIHASSKGRYSVSTMNKNKEYGFRIAVDISNNAESSKRKIEDTVERTEIENVLPISSDYEKALRGYQAQNYRKAESILQSIIGQYPDDQRTINLLLNIYVQENRVTDIKNLLLPRLKVITNAQLTVLVKILLAENDNLGALNILNKSGERKSADILLLKAKIYQKNNMHREAITMLDDAAAKGLNMEVVKINKAISYEALGMNSEALKEYEFVSQHGQISSSMQAFIENRIKSLRIANETVK